MLMIIVAVAISGVVLWWLAGLAPNRTVATRLARGLGIALVAISAVVGGTWLWALTATDTSQLARAIAWGDSSVDDLDRIPSRPMAASNDPLVFVPKGDIPVADFTFGEPALPLDQYLETHDTSAFLVVHDDELLYEGYFNGSSHDALQTSFSVAKSFVATLVGIAIDEGVIGSLDDPVTDYVPELAERDERFDAITLHHLITMSSGLSFAEGASPWADPANTYHGIDLRSAVLETPEIEQPPGVAFHYNDWNVILLGLVLERSTGMSVAEFTESRLWQPMGAEADGSWSLDSDEHRFEKSFVGVNARAIDFAKLGWLYLHDGRRGNQQVVPADFVRSATRVDSVEDPADFYQYLWWVESEEAAYFANGDHGQLIYVDPSSDLVIVRHGTTGGGVDWTDLMQDLVRWLQPQLGAG